MKTSWPVDSTDRCNSLRKMFGRRVKAQRLTWSHVEFACDRVELALREVAETRAVGKILTE